MCLRIKSLNGCLWISVGILSVLSLSAQNLVKNPEMEEGPVFASDFNKISLAEGWSSATKGTVDLFSRHASKKKNGIPVNRQGKQTISDSANYAGIIAYSDPKEKKGYCEYLRGELVSVLEKGKTYHVSFKVSLSEKSTRAVGGLGAVFSVAQMKEKHASILKILPNIQTSDIISDTKNWTEIAGEYTAMGGEKWIILGAFSSNMNAVNVKKDLKYKENRAYYYITDVRVEELKESGTDKKGSSDSDKDGVADNDDKCPTVAGVILNKGCPEVKEEEKEIFQQALQDIQFETGIDVIKPTSFEILDKVVEVMISNPAYLLKIEGHTDNVGDDEKNLSLSQKRADAVKKYLETKGVATERTLAQGFGETVPLADNTTEAGKANNRRVEFKVEF